MKTKNRVLFIGPTYMDIYLDVIAEFERQGYEVDFIKERQRNNDPFSVRYEFFRPHLGIERQKAEYWKNLLQQPQYAGCYDLLFVIDGQGLHASLFDILLERNPNMQCVNYLFDTTYGVYHFEYFFDRFDQIFTFDLGESRKYGIGFLPIYWVASDNSVEVNEKYVMFGFGAYNPNRFEVFTHLSEYCREEQLPAFIHLFEKMKSREWVYVIKQLMRRLIGLRAHMPLSHYHSPIITDRTLSPTDFRRFIYQSRVTIDTHPAHQDGLTARFMWALGAKKKIITTNSNICQYDFYSPEQIFVLKGNDDIEQESDINLFINSNSQIPEEKKKIIERYRIDNWMRTLLGESR